MSSAPYDLNWHHETLREIACAYVRLEELHAATIADSSQSGADHIEFWNIIQRLFPRDALDEARLPDDSLYVGDSLVSFGSLQDISAHRLIYRLCVDTLEEILQIAHELVPNPTPEPWPPKEVLCLSDIAPTTSEGVDDLISTIDALIWLVYSDKSGRITSTILHRLHLRPLRTKLGKIHLVLELEYHRAAHRQTVIEQRPPAEAGDESPAVENARQQADALERTPLLPDETEREASDLGSNPAIPALPSYFNGRLRFDDATRTVYLDGKPFQVKHAALYHALHLIAKSEGQIVEAETIRDKVRGCSADLSKMLKRLPPVLFKILSPQSGHGGGYAIILPQKVGRRRAMKSD